MSTSRTPSTTRSARSRPAGVVTTLAGSPGQIGSADGTGSAARFDEPIGIAVGSSGNVYVADEGNDTIRKITPAGVVTTLAGSPGQTGSADGTGSAARFTFPSGIAVNAAGNVYVGDETDTIREITPAGVVTTLAGDADHQGTTDGTGSTALFEQPAGLAVDAAGNVYVADIGADTIRKITPAGVVTTLAGSPGQTGSADGTGSAARFSFPTSVAVDGTGNVYVADNGNDTIREITPAGVVTTLAGTAGQHGSANGTGTAALFYGPYAVAVDSAGDTVYVADSDNETIRELSIATVPAQSGVTGTSPVSVSAALTGLAPGTTYYDRAVATNALGTTYGTILSFTTSNQRARRDNSGRHGHLDDLGDAQRQRQPREQHNHGLLRLRHQLHARDRHDDDRRTIDRQRDDQRLVERHPVRPGTRYHLLLPGGRHQRRRDHGWRDPQLHDDPEPAHRHDPGGHGHLIHRRHAQRQRRSGGQRDRGLLRLRHQLHARDGHDDHHRPIGRQRNDGRLDERDADRSGARNHVLLRSGRDQRRRHDGRRDPQLRHHGGHPDATTQGASLISNTTVALFANVNPDGSETNVSFVYGTSPTLSAGTTTTAAQSIGNGTSSVGVSSTVSGLTPGTTYYFQVVATNAVGTTDGAILGIVTDGPPTQLAVTTEPPASVAAGRELRVDGRAPRTPSAMSPPRSPAR